MYICPAKPWILLFNSIRVVYLNMSTQMHFKIKMDVWNFVHDKNKDRFITYSKNNLKIVKRVPVINPVALLLKHPSYYHKLCTENQCN